MNNLLHIRNLVVEYPVHGKKGRTLRAVDGVSFSIAKNEVVGLVGESGCGKTTTGNSIIGLAPVTSGSISFCGRQTNLRTLAETRQFRREVQMIFQDPMGSLNPRLTVGNAIMETLSVHRKHLKLDSDALRLTRSHELLEMVGLNQNFFNRYPHELSGGQRQRIGIARALAVRPKLLIADEPVSALDVSIQVQILNLLKKLSKELSFSCLFIAHDLAVVRYMCDRTLVMYLGEIVEEANTENLFSNPLHPYTRALLSAVPDVKKGLASRNKKSNRIILQGEIPSRLELIPGCPFNTRCQHVAEKCYTDRPQSTNFENNHITRCHFAGVWS